MKTKSCTILLGHRMADYEQGPRILSWDTAFLNQNSFWWLLKKNLEIDIDVHSKLRVCAMHFAFLRPWFCWFSIPLWLFTFYVKYIPFPKALYHFWNILLWTSCQPPWNFYPHVLMLLMLNFSSPNLGGRRYIFKLPTHTLRAVALLRARTQCHRTQHKWRGPLTLVILSLFLLCIN